MLAAFFRGAFLIGILAWYSVSVWKMIDGYFRDQFTSYLHEEYRKNPRMKSDVREMKTNDKNEPVVTDVEPSFDKMFKPEPEVYLDDNADADKLEPLEVLNNDETKELASEIISEREMKENLQNDEVKNIEKEVEKKKNEKVEASKIKEEEIPRRGKKKRVKTITLKEEDFLSVKKARGTIERDEDFWEFDEGEEGGIPIAALPYKPRLDIGKLERVTPDEYCPFTLEDEFSCGETTEWP